MMTVTEHTMWKRLPARGAERRAYAVAHRKNGATFKEIGNLLGVTGNQARMLVLSAEDDARWGQAGDISLPVREHGLMARYDLTPMAVIYATDAELKALLYVAESTIQVVRNAISAYLLA